jgi:hypothetical protein
MSFVPGKADDTAQNGRKSKKPVSKDRLFSLKAPAVQALEHGE